ncbi:hypothetical protein C0J52_20949, partial [Blattella germanica]
PLEVSRWVVTAFLISNRAVSGINQILSVIARSIIHHFRERHFYVILYKKQTCFLLYNKHVLFEQWRLYRALVDFYIVCIELKTVFY